MVSGLGYLGAGLSGILPGYNQEYDASLQQAGQAALGRTLQMLGPGGQQPVQPPPTGGGMPPQQPQQMAGPPPMPQGSPPVGGPPGGGPPPPQLQQPTGGPPIGPPLQVGPGQGPPPQQQPQQQPQGGGPGPQPQGWGPQGGGGFDIRQIVQQIVRANPGVPPQVIANATEGFIRTYLPVQLREQALQQGYQLGLWRVGAQNYRTDVGAQTAEDKIAAQRDIAGQASADRRYGIETRAETAAQGRFSREEIAKMNDATKRDLVAQGILSRQEIAEAQIGERHYEADTRATTAAQAEAGRETRSVRQAETAQRGQNIRAQTAAEAETGRMKRAELSADTKKEITKLSLETRREIASSAEAGRTQRTQLSNEARKEIAGMSEKAKAELAQYLEGGRMERAEQARTSREDIAAQNRAAADERSRRTAETADKNRIARQAHQAITSDQAWQRLELQRQNLQRQIKEGGQRNLVSAYRMILDQQHKRSTELIQSWSLMNNMPPEVRKQMIDDADKAYDNAIKALSGGGYGGPQQQPTQ